MEEMLTLLHGRPCCSRLLRRGSLAWEKVSRDSKRGREGEKSTFPFVECLIQAMRKATWSACPLEGVVGAQSVAAIVELFGTFDE